MEDNSKQQPSTSSQSDNSFVTGLVKDNNETYTVPGSWSHARNASKVTAVGDLSTLSNEQSNLFCAQTPYTLIGVIHLFEDKWVLFSTNNSPILSGQPSEIGYFTEGQCLYQTLVTDPCPSIINRANSNFALNFSTQFLIKGASKQNFDCTWGVYFGDNNNVDRYISVDISGPIPKIVDSQFINKCTDPCGNTYFSNQIPPSCTTDGCHICNPTCSIDPDLIRLASLVESPCVQVNKAKSGGSLPNGSYFATIRYTINEQPVTDFTPPSNVQALFSHQNLAGALDLTFTGLDTTHFTEFELTIVRNINQQTSAKRIGIYSTFSKEIFIDSINEALPSIPIEQLPLRTPVWEKSEAIYPVGNYLVRVAPTSKFDFNYQPLANRIQAKWISVEYPSDYYRKGGNVTSYLRDEIYSFFIRWIFDTGDRSSSYHIPGRVAKAGELNPNNTSDSIDLGTELEFEVNNTAALNNGPSIPRTLSDGGVVIAEGDMAYWQSTELYPDNKPEIWDLSSWQTIWGPTNPNIPSGDFTTPAYNLCGLPIRHHKMPDNLIDPSCNHFHNYGSTPNPDIKIRVLGVEFDHIYPPLDNLGNSIPGIVGYEILRGSREGNKTVIAKGMINNMQTYNTVNHPFPQPPDGLFQNYPYNCLGLDRTLSRTQTSGGFSSVISQVPLPGPRNDIFTFHSPDTQFRHPFLAVNELKIYGELYGQTIGAFRVTPGHPKEKLLNDLSFIVASLVGVGETMLAIRGQRIHRRRAPYVNNIGLFADVPKMKPGSFDITGTIPGAITTTGGTFTPGIGDSGSEQDAYKEKAPSDDSGAPKATDANTQVKNAIAQYLADDKSAYSPGIINLLSLITTGVDSGDNTAWGDLTLPNSNATEQPGINYASQELERQDSELDRIPSTIRAINGIMLASHYWTLGTDTALRFIKAIVQFRDYAYSFLSEGLYSSITVGNIKAGSRRYNMLDANYLDNSRQSFTDRSPAPIYSTLSINNLYRSQAVVLQALQQRKNPITIAHSVTDTSYSTIKDVGYTTPTDPITKDISSFYTALIQRIKNQYGQLDSIIQVPVSCPIPFTPGIDNSSSEIFGGDTYISRYTEKNTFFYFWDWLYNQPDGFEFDYRSRYMITYPTFWADFTQYEAGELLNNFPIINFPSSKAALDRNVIQNIFVSILGLRFGIFDSYFYLFQSGVRDFFVESEVNTDLRDWGDLPEERYYDPYIYGDLYSLFDTKIIKTANYFKYDYSLSISRLFQNFTSWGNLQFRDYSPFIASTCYVTRPNRIIYSLPQQLEERKDYWRVYLVNNYRDFYSKVSAMKPINKTGAVILFKADSPIMFTGTDQLQTELGVKVTVGDGGLFAQAEQNVVNTEVSLEYGSCQDRLSIINTPFGLYYMCANQGKVFKVGADQSRIYRGMGALDDITYHGLKFWFKEYLPFWLLKDFPTFDITDNPVAGIGCQAIYDNQIETIYFCKKDYRLLDQYRINQDPTQPPDKFGYIGNGQFRYIDPNAHKIIVNLGDPVYFQDASWTVSYDPKAEKGGWISFHDWHPDLNIPSKNNFLTSKGNQIWRHNDRNDLYCNYYSQQFPFEVEFIAPTGITVNTLRSIEYYLECYKYAPGRLDRFHVLDENFDHAVIYNTEQVSGLLTLILMPKNDPFRRLGLVYPQVHFTKEENKYRFQRFFDMTRDRGEFPPFAQQMIWITDPNGYTRTLNPNNINLAKSELQRKKFRHYLNRVSLSKVPPPGQNINYNYIVKASLEKELVSLR